ncbi:eCIS core domain-containing protein [Coleofasciculus sp. E2-BRE-01]|uniref:eCIS core domain-containing protein n=1 Tax=Coleofasciculus sp. E2-BRE-01 TaxID=3069524 RepID=UPI003305039A
MATHQSLPKTANAKKKSDILPIPAQSKSHPVIAQPKIESTRSNEEQLAQMRAQREASERLGSTLLTPESVPRTLPPLQPKLTIGQPGDQYEQEADRVARQVVDHINAPPKIQAKETHQPMSVGQRKPSPLDHLPAQKVQRHATGEPMDASADGIGVSGVQKENKTGLSDKLKAGIETLSGISMDDVKVHYHSSKPAQLQALAYTQGTDIHVAPGQEQHLPHEAWHVVQQKQGRVKPTTQTKEVAINDDEGLELEADVMGSKALQLKYTPSAAIEGSPQTSASSENSVKVFLNCPYTSVVSTIPVQRYVYRGKYGNSWERVEKKEATELLNLLDSLKSEYKDISQIIDEIFESEEHRILLYSLNDKEELRSELNALQTRIQSPQAPEASPSKGSGWRTGRADQAIRDANKATTIFDTGHHKLPKSTLQWVYNLMSKEQKEQMRSTLSTLDLPSDSGVNALKSLYSNITLGPGSDQRKDDPGQEPDWNYNNAPEKSSEKSGEKKLQRTKTPRSLMYDELYQYIRKIGGPPQINIKKESLNQYEFDRILNYLETAEKLHALITRTGDTGAGGLDRNTRMWDKGKEQKWTKKEMKEEVKLPDDVESDFQKTVRELKDVKNQAKEMEFSLYEEDRKRLINRLTDMNIKVNEKLKQDPENQELLIKRATIMHEIMDLMRMKR